MKVKFFVISLLVVISISHSYAQFGKLLREKAEKLKKEVEEKSKEKLIEKIEAQNASFDSTVFLLGLSVVDNSGIYEKFEVGKALNKSANYLLQVEQSDEPIDRAKRWIDTGEPLYSSRKFKAAEKAFEAAKLILESESLTETLDYARVIANLGLLYNTSGRFAKSMELSQKALTMRAELFGKESKGYIASLNNYAVLSKDLGNYSDSEKSINEAIDLSKAINETESATYAVLLNNKAMTYQSVGRYKEATVLLNQALIILDGITIDLSGNYQKVMTNLGFVYQSMSDYQQAELAYEKATQKLNKKSPVYAQAITNLASLYLDMGRTEEVEGKLLNAKDIYEEKFGAEHPLYAAAIFNLGKFYMSIDNYTDAQNWLEKTLQIRENVLDKKHPAYIDALEEVAILNWKQGLHFKAKNQFTEALNETLEFINNHFSSMSENEKAKYWDKLRPRFEAFFAFAYEVSNKMPEVLIDMYNYQLATKGMLLSAGNKIKKQILRSGNEELIGSYQLWLDQKEMLARYYSYSKEELKSENINIDSLELEANKIEKKLSEKSSFFGNGAVNTLTYLDVKASLDADDVALEIIRISSNNEVKYGILTVDSQSDMPSITRIDNGIALETKFYKYFRNTTKNKIADEYSYSQYWQPIEPSIKSKKQLYISLDGIYNQISLNALQDRNGVFVVDNWDITIVGNTKELIDLKKKTNSDGGSKSAFIMGNPDYGNEAIVAALPGTKKEVEQISEMLRASDFSIDLQMTAFAREDNLKKVYNPNVLHIATHGYFQQDVTSSHEKVFGINPENAKENPLLRSGLMFSGAAHTLSGDSTSILDLSNDNGILTAYEAMSLSLDDTELVVLSACETGLGDVKSGEGVYGLQRAFLVAGADALIMSLWKVNDSATQKLMSVFYENWLASGNKHEAFKQAQLSLKKQFPEPYFWGAFVLIGG